MSRPTFDPIEAIKQLPWPNLLAAAGVALAIAVVVDWLLGFAVLLCAGLLGRFVPEVANAILTFTQLPANQFLLSLMVSASIGVLALYLLEKRFLTTRSINMPILWGLVGSLMLALLCFWLSNLFLNVLGIPILVHGLGLVGANQLEVVAIALGVFLYGKRYL